MIGELNRLISKYGGRSQFEKEATQAERERLFILQRAVEIEYNDYRFGHRNRIDSFIGKCLISEENINIDLIQEQNESYSIFSMNYFEGESNITNPEQYSIGGLPRIIEFQSLFQYLIFHKCVLFLEKELAGKVLKDANKESLMAIDSKINNYNTTVWTENKTQILEKGLQSLLKTSKGLMEKLFSMEADYFVFDSTYEDLGVTDIQGFINDEMQKMFNYKNYWGKILSKAKYEMNLK